jgi:hypothetical protein
MEEPNKNPNQPGFLKLKEINEDLYFILSGIYLDNLSISIIIKVYVLHNYFINEILSKLSF